jgi:hypothetical protein
MKTSSRPLVMRTASGCGYDESKSSSSTRYAVSLSTSGDQFSARYESEMQPTQVALNGDVQPLPVGDDGHRVVGGHFGAPEIHLLIRPGDFRDHQIERRDAVWKSHREDSAGGTCGQSRGQKFGDLIDEALGDRGMLALRGDCGGVRGGQSARGGRRGWSAAPRASRTPCCPAPMRLPRGAPRPAPSQSTALRAAHRDLSAIAATHPRTSP